MWRNDLKFSEVRQEHNILRSRGDHQLIDGGTRHPTHLHSGFGQFFDVFLTLQVLELVAELIIGAVVNEKPWDEI